MQSAPLVDGRLQVAHTNGKLRILVPLLRYETADLSQRLLPLLHFVLVRLLCVIQLLFELCDLCGVMLHRAVLDDLLKLLGDAKQLHVARLCDKILRHHLEARVLPFEETDALSELLHVLQTLDLVLTQCDNRRVELFHNRAVYEETVGKVRKQRRLFDFHLSLLEKEKNFQIAGDLDTLVFECLELAQQILYINAQFLILRLTTLQKLRNLGKCCRASAHLGLGLNLLPAKFNEALIHLGIHSRRHINRHISLALQISARRVDVRKGVKLVGVVACLLSLLQSVRLCVVLLTPAKQPQQSVSLGLIGISNLAPKLTLDGLVVGRCRLVRILARLDLPPEHCHCRRRLCLGKFLLLQSQRQLHGALVNLLLQQECLFQAHNLELLTVDNLLNVNALFKQLLEAIVERGASLERRSLQLLQLCLECLAALLALLAHGVLLLLKFAEGFDFVFGHFLLRPVHPLGAHKLLQQLVVVGSVEASAHHEVECTLLCIVPALKTQPLFLQALLLGQTRTLFGANVLLHGNFIFRDCEKPLGLLNIGHLRGKELLDRVQFSHNVGNAIVAFLDLTNLTLLLPQNALKLAVEFALDSVQNVAKQDNLCALSLCSVQRERIVEKVRLQVPLKRAVVSEPLVLAVGVIVVVPNRVVAAVAQATVAVVFRGQQSRLNRPPRLCLGNFNLPHCLDVVYCLDLLPRAHTHGVVAHLELAGKPPEALPGRLHRVPALLLEKIAQEHSGQILVANVIPNSRNRRLRLGAHPLHEVGIEGKLVTCQSLNFGDLAVLCNEVLESALQRRNSLVNRRPRVPKVGVDCTMHFRECKLKLKLRRSVGALSHSVARSECVLNVRRHRRIHLRRLLRRRRNNIHRLVTLVAELPPPHRHDAVHTRRHNPRMIWSQSYRTCTPVPVIVRFGPAHPVRRFGQTNCDTTIRRRARNPVVMRRDCYETAALVVSGHRCNRTDGTASH
eukprot:Opistho-2@23314